MEFLRGFNSAWPGGFSEGQPLDPMGASTYGIYGYNSVLYTVYSACIRPYITPDTVVLEIGPGRGAWSKTFLERNCKKLYAVDAAAPEHTHFWDYVGKDARAEYIVTEDFSLKGVPDNSIDYFFSFGVFCHLKPEMCEEYIQSLGPKMRSGSRGFLYIADFDKYNRCLANAESLTFGRFLAAQTRKVWMPAKYGYLLAWKYFRSKMDLEGVSKSRERNLWNTEGSFGWYHLGVDRACAALKGAGFEIVEADIEVTHRDPIIHFVKR